MLTDRGTACYSPPEIRAGLIWNERVDIWSGGLSICYAFLGQLPFDQDNGNVQEALKRGLAPSMDLSRLPALVANLVEQCLVAEPSDRPPAVELLVHPAFGGGRGRPAGAHAEAVRGLPCGRPAYDVDVIAACGLLWRLPVGEGLEATRARDNDSALLEVRRWKSAEPLLGGRGALPHAVGLDAAPRVASPPPGAAGEAERLCVPSVRRRRRCGRALEEPPPRCDRGLVWSTLARRRFSRCSASAAPILQEVEVGEPA
ncbi:unnamed protein product [Prorocentrum cordatum]|uniref:Protein kinase domain-containing protein n=1 Tax=Prorocentrum cordatum TaxID=2364126 RepID=A0ABN9RTZ6_9DINO|nr:unnamed protein product [Polarella glacialis]